MARFLLWLSDRLRVRVVLRDDGDRYLERYFLFRFWRFTFYLHRFLASDPGPETHNHPWHSISVILSGGYVEERRYGSEIHTFIRYPGRVNLIWAETFHRVIIPAGHECWTLFIHGKRFARWGFLFTESHTTRIDNGGHLQTLAFEEVVGGGAQWYRHSNIRGRDVRYNG